jgi:hypothetical protein
MFIASALLEDLEAPSRLSRLALTLSVDALQPLGQIGTDVLDNIHSPSAKMEPLESGMLNASYAA